MPEVRVFFDGDNLGLKWKRATSRNRDAVLLSTRQASAQVAIETERQGRANIASAGHFGQRWLDGLHCKVTEGGGFVRIETFHDIPYFWTHQKGALIKGKPLLFIPFSFASDAQGISARDYPGKLFRVERSSDGLIMLLSSGDGQPKYFGKSQVRVPKRFRVVEIAQAVAKRFNEFYQAAFRANRDRG